MLEDFWNFSPVIVVALGILFIILSRRLEKGKRIERLEQLIHEEVNRVRKSHGLKPLEWDPLLNKIAREHSEDMALKNYVDHKNKKGESPSDRALRHRYPTSIAENIYQGFLYKKAYYKNGVPIEYDWLSDREMAKEVVKGWLNSPGHRKNLLHPHYRKEGIGVAITKDWKILVTQNLS